MSEVVRGRIIDLDSSFDDDPTRTNLEIYLDVPTTIGDLDYVAAVNMSNSNQEVVIILAKEFEKLTAWAEKWGFSYE